MKICNPGRSLSRFQKLMAVSRYHPQTPTACSTVCGFNLHTFAYFGCFYICNCEPLSSPCAKVFFANGNWLNLPDEDSCWSFVLVFGVVQNLNFSFRDGRQSSVSSGDIPTFIISCAFIWTTLSSNNRFARQTYFIIGSLKSGGHSRVPISVLLGSQTQFSVQHDLQNAGYKCDSVSIINTFASISCLFFVTRTYQYFQSKVIISNRKMGVFMQQWRFYMFRK